jgi:tRNA 2-thiouridine synthesizing protein A
MDISSSNNNNDMDKSKLGDPSPDGVLDITQEVCPMTFVRTRLALDRLRAGECLLVLLRGEEPRRNVPRAAREQGHQLLLQETAADGVTRLLIRKSAAP